MTTTNTLAGLRLARFRELAAELALLDRAVREAMEAITAVPSPISMDSASLGDFIHQVDMAEAEAIRLVALRDEKQRRYDALLWR